MIAVHLSFLSALTYQFSNEDWYIASVFLMLHQTRKHYFPSDHDACAPSRNVRVEVCWHSTSNYFPIVFYIKIANFRALFGRHHLIQFTINTS